MPNLLLIVREIIVLTKTLFLVWLLANDVILYQSDVCCIIDYFEFCVYRGLS